MQNSTTDDMSRWQKVKQWWTKDRHSTINMHASQNVSVDFVESWIDSELLEELRVCTYR